MHHKAAIDIDGLAGNVMGTGGGQKDRHVGNILRLLPAFEGDNPADFVHGPLLKGELLLRR